MGTLKADLVPLQGGNALLEENIGILLSFLETGDIDLLELDGDVVGLEDGSDSVGGFDTNTVTYNTLLNILIKINPGKIEKYLVLK